MSDEFVLKTSKSRALYNRARQVFPQGVSYGIRHFDPYPFYTTKAKGSKLYDADGNEYVDFWLGHWALILGHAPSIVIEAVQKQLEAGTHYGTSHDLEIKLAEQVTKMVPSVQMVRFTNSGTEANMYAVRLARAYTKRTKIAKFEGGWHGGYDALHIGVKYPFELPESAGLTNGAIEDTVLLPYNNLERVEKELKDDAYACIVVEPLLGAGGGVPAEREFLKGLRELCDEKATLLIFDEVVTGFRLAPGGAQQYYHVAPDITILGKILGGGFPAGALCASRDIMEYLDASIHRRPTQSFHGGTFAANPITMTAGLATLEALEDGTLINKLNALGCKIRRQTKEIFERNGIDVCVTGAGSIFSTHFTKEEVRDALAVYKADRKSLLEYHTSLIANGVFLLPGHNGALSASHCESDIERLYRETEEYARAHSLKSS